MYFYVCLAFTVSLERLNSEESPDGTTISTGNVQHRRLGRSLSMNLNFASMSLRIRKIVPRKGLGIFSRSTSDETEENVFKDSDLVGYENLKDFVRNEEFESSNGDGKG